MTDKCFRNTPLVAIWIQHLLSSKTLHITFVVVLGIGKFLNYNYDSNFATAVNLLSSEESAIYSASVVLSDIKYFIFMTTYLDNRQT